MRRLASRRSQHRTRDSTDLIVDLAGMPPQRLWIRGKAFPCGRDNAAAGTRTMQTQQLLDAPAGRAQYGCSVGRVEPVFANLLYIDRLERFTRRGRMKIQRPATALLLDAPRGIADPCSVCGIHHGAKALRVVVEDGSIARTRLQSLSSKSCHR